MGMIAAIAAIASFIAATVMLVLRGLGLMHARRVSPAAEFLSGPPAPEPTPVPASSPLADHGSDQQPGDEGLVAATPAAHPASRSNHELSSARLARAMIRTQRFRTGCHHGPFGILIFELTYGGKRMCRSGGCRVSG
jgi:hypothetical protein